MPVGLADAQRLTVLDKEQAAGVTRVQKLIPVRFSQLETVL
jgi:hypothetical protein